MRKAWGRRFSGKRSRVKDDACSIEEDAREIYERDGQLRTKHLPTITGISRTTIEALIRQGKGPVYFQEASGCVRVFESVDVRNWILSKKRGGGS